MSRSLISSYIVRQNEHTVVLPVKTYANANEFKLEDLTDSIWGTPFVGVGVKTFRTLKKGNAIIVKIIITRASPGCEEGSEDSAYLVQEWQDITPEWMQDLAITVFNIVFEKFKRELNDMDVVDVVDNYLLHSKLIKS